MAFCHLHITLKYCKTLQLSSNQKHILRPLPYALKPTKCVLVNTLMQKRNEKRSRVIN